MSELDQLLRRQRTAADMALRAIAEDLAGRAQRRAPIEEGTLRASADVELDRHPSGTTAVVSFSTPYAQYQHEELGLQHPRGGEPKYLERALKEMLPRYERAFAAALRRAL